MIAADGTDTSPRLSVITANYNHGHVIVDAIRSVTEQTRPVFEHVVVDDASTDSSVETIRSLQRDNPHLRLVTLSRNGGAPAAFGRGIAEARGEVVMFLAADDVLLPGAAAALVQVFDGNPDAVLVTGDERFVSMDGAFWLRRYVIADEPKFFTPRELVQKQRAGLPMINGPATALRRDAAERSAMKEPELRWHHDWFAFNAVAYRHGLWYVPQVVHEFRVSPSSYSWGSRKWGMQRHVLDCLFEQLDGDEYSDVRECFRDSGMLAYLPMIGRYMLANPTARAFVTRHLVQNILLFAGYRASTRILPRSFLERVIRLKTTLSQQRW